ncbi:hypothetical protein [Nocardia camponoti]|uniref:Di-and tripeptidase n=1 Tax=Nocardia camponoti TaxID=1616106 RepID=A0A917QEI5_9NOCA|nr:hypothetical protein [Nocardia camponoti]GGK47004.1 hypothetical protein GCM10011591_17880 [Nocardia camponoti]
MFKGAIEKAVVDVLDTGSKLQAPAVRRYVEYLREKHPGESPAQIVTRLEKQYLLAVTGSGAAVGATAAVPGIGTVAALGAVSAETVFFMEASALFTLAEAYVHGIEPEDKEARRAMVLAVVLGDAGMAIVQKGIGTQAKNWTGALAGKVPGIAGINSKLLQQFIKRFITKRAMLMFGKVLPAGIGAAVGAAGNRTLGHTTIDNARKAFGPAPAHWPTFLDAPGKHSLEAKSPTVLPSAPKQLGAAPTEVPPSKPQVHKK